MSRFRGNDPSLNNQRQREGERERERERDRGSPVEISRKSFLRRAFNYELDDVTTLSLDTITAADVSLTERV